MAKPTVLVADDERRVLESLEGILKDKYSVLPAESGREVRRFIANEQVDVVILDYYLLDIDASHLLPEILQTEQSPEVIVISGKANTKEAVGCMKLGAYDFKLKPYDVEELLVSIANALRKRKLEFERRRLLNHNLDRYRIIGKSAAMRELRDQIERFADSEATVLIQGETGTGKELVAHQIHYRSGRASGPMQIINCVAVPKDLADSELFGHAKGAFTGALRDKPGKVELAGGGTLFLDEIGDMPLELQAKLLRFLETGEFERIGENKVRKSDVRVVAATHRDLDSAVKEGFFRQDLFYRLNVCTISISPLRDHKEDIPELVEAFSMLAAARHNKPLKRLTDDAVAELIKWDWPGNVRELLHLVEQAVVYFPKEELSSSDLLLLPFFQSREKRDKDDLTLAEIRERAERDAILSRIIKYGGPTEEAAKSLGIHRSSLYRKAADFGIS